MRFEPVFVAPSGTGNHRGVSRRAFVVGVLGSLGFGSVVGARARGTGLATEPASAARHADAEPALPFLDECLALADAPLDDLVAGSALYFVVFGATEDTRLVPGLERLALAVTEDHPAIAGQRATLAAALTAEISSRQAAHEAMADLLPRLRSVR
jgi:hypothetical protein